MFPEWKEWILKIIVSALLGGLADAMSRNSRQNTLVKMSASLMTLAVVMSPITKIDMGMLRNRWDHIAVSGNDAAASGQSLQNAVMRSCTAENLASWVESRAASEGIVCCAEVILDEDFTPSSVKVVSSDLALQGNASLYSSIAAELGISNDELEVVILHEGTQEPAGIVPTAPA